MTRTTSALATLLAVTLGGGVFAAAEVVAEPPAATASSRPVSVGAIAVSVGPRGAEVWVTPDEMESLGCQHGRAEKALPAHVLPAEVMNLPRSLRDAYIVGWARGVRERTAGDPQPAATVESAHPAAQTVTLTPDNTQHMGYRHGLDGVTLPLAIFDGWPELQKAYSLGVTAGVMQRTQRSADVTPPRSQPRATPRLSAQAVTRETTPRPSVQAVTDETTHPGDRSRPGDARTEVYPSSSSSWSFSENGRTYHGYGRPWR